MSAMVYGMPIEIFQNLAVKIDDEERREDKLYDRLSKQMEKADLFRSKGDVVKLELELTKIARTKRALFNLTGVRL